MAVAGQGALGATLLSACGAGHTSTSPSAAAGRPVRGGVFQVGMITAGSAETLDPTNPAGSSNVDLLRWVQLYDTLFTIGPDISQVLPALAVGADSNSSATVWTLRLRDGVTWHDGKPFTADDVVYTVKSWSNPNTSGYSNAYGLIDFNAVRKRGRLTVEIPLVRPVSQFPSLLTQLNFTVIQNGATRHDLAAHPIGTGPFSYVSFTPGQQSVFAANRHYWEHDGPYVDSLVVNSSFSDDNARLNALLSGSINVAPLFPPLLAKQQLGSSQVTILRAAGSQSYWMYMRVDRPPFDDVRVRQAMKLIADRPALVANALDGFGTVANDLVGTGTKFFAGSLHQEHDVDRAKSLLRAAGRTGLTVTLSTSGVAPGFVEAATLFAQQASAAGVTIKIQQLPESTYFSSSAGYPYTFGQDGATGVPYPSLTAAYENLLARSAPANESYWGSQPGGAAADRLLQQAVAATNPATAARLWHEVQELQFTQGGLLVFADAEFIDAVAANVHGLQTTPAGNLNYYRFLNGWVAKA